MWSVHTDTTASVCVCLCVRELLSKRDRLRERPIVIQHAFSQPHSNIDTAIPISNCSAVHQVHHISYTMNFHFNLYKWQGMEYIQRKWIDKIPSGCLEHYTDIEIHRTNSIAHTHTKKKTIRRGETHFGSWHIDFYSRSPNKFNPILRTFFNAGLKNLERFRRIIQMKWTETHPKNKLTTRSWKTEMDGIQEKPLSCKFVVFVVTF